MSRPTVAVVAMPAARISGLRRSGYAVSGRVVEAVVRAGADPVVVPPLGRCPDLGRFDAVVLPGGDDVGADPEHDRFDADVVRAALAADLPLLAICRGLQLLNVMRGGSLVADLPPGPVPHLDARHEVELAAGSLIAEAVGATRVGVSSYHHQAIDRLGDGLRVTGRAPDGVVEAVELPGARVLAVQWHPEDDAAHVPHDQAVFDRLVSFVGRGAT